MTGNATRRGRRSVGFNDGQIDSIVERMALVGNPPRLKILSLLSQGDFSVHSLCEAMELSQPGVSHHLARLRIARLVDAERRGRERFYSMNDLGWSVLDACKRLL